FHRVNYFGAPLYLSGPARLVSRRRSETMHMKLAALVLLACAAPTGAFAQVSCPVAIDAQACSSCHGTDDQSSIPRLMGMDRDAFVAAMEAFQLGERDSTIMGRLA